MIKFNKSLLKNDNPIVNDLINKFINMNSDGKCIRGLLIDLGYKLTKNDNYSLKLSASYETFEKYTLGTVVLDSLWVGLSTVGKTCRS